MPVAARTTLLDPQPFLAQLFVICQSLPPRVESFSPRPLIASQRR